MYSPKVYSIFHNLEKQSCNICAEVDAFVGNILDWADELGGIVEKEFTAGKESALFRLPETPSEKKTRNRKARNAVISKCSVTNSTFLQNEISNLDNTISSRTRGAKRAATLKMSQFNTTNNINEICFEMKQETLVVEKNATNASDATFVMPKAGTRTKPVLKNKQPEGTVESEHEEPKTPVLQSNETQALNISKESPKRSSFQKRGSKLDGSSPGKRSSSKMSRTSSCDSGERNGISKAPIVVNETPTELRVSRRKISRTLSQSPTERQSSRKTLRTLSGSPVVRSSSVIVPRNPSKSPLLRSSGLRITRNSARNIDVENRFSKNGNKNDVSTSQNLKISTPEIRTSLGNTAITVKKELTPIAASTFVLNDLHSDEERTPIVKESRFFRSSKTSTPAIDAEKTPVVNLPNVYVEENLAINAGSGNVAESTKNSTVTVNAENITEEVPEDAGIPKKKRKVKKGEEVKENIQEMGDTVRITRTKSKAIKQMMEENESKQADLSAFAKKLLNRAKMTSMKKSQLAALLECNTSTPTHGPGHLGNNLPFGNLTTSKSKYHLLLSSSKKLKTPLATLPNSAMKIPKASGDKERVKPKIISRDSSVENPIRSVTKPPKDDLFEREIKLKSKKEKEEEAALKRQNVIKSKQEELKRKNELKHQMAMKQREKLEQEKYHNMIQSEKEKEERHKLILQERQMKLKEEAFKKKMLTQQKIAETVERRRMEEEARIAKLKEMEAEEQRLALEKQKEQERQEKRAQERLAQKKAREEYEMQLKQELEAERLRAEKLLTAKKCLASASKIQSASKRQKFGIIGDKREWDYKPRNENDYGLEDEHSEVDSEDEKSYDKTKPIVPWGKKVMHGKSPVVKILTLEMLCEFMPCYQKSPDIYKMFKMTPSKRIKRSSSAIWNTPSS